ncbi:MAG TPA: sugar phosphate nucleotidyltransferase, partial [Hyphomonas sp.]|nr:mannose-1-phosphate guanylyltransferase/mannose-6-phosphate isomerase [Hyphomonas sp.]HRJ00404.1 sugar phosphate nucleotidyltransferase [Hyphomonas sp.]
GQPETFTDAVREAASAAAEGYITTFGIAPDRPETGFGYIQSGERLSGKLQRVAAFKEKPDSATAAEYLASGRYSWNAGIFLFRPETMLTELGHFAPGVLDGATRALAAARTDGANIYLDPAAFAMTPSISVDYAVMEHTAHAAVLAPLDCAWNDIGTWTAVGDVSSRPNCPAAIEIDTSGCLVHAREGQLVALVGVEDLIVVADGNRILITRKDRAQDVGAVVKALKESGQKDYL